jgi:hypothetical protein
VAAPALVTGGHTLAHSPVQLELDALSPSNKYTVSFFGPAARITPGLPCLLTTATPVAAAEVDVAVVVAAVGDLVAAALVVAVLLLLPQPAASSATIVAIAPRAKGCLTVASSGVGEWFDASIPQTPSVSASFPRRGWR